MKFGHHGANHPVQDLDSGRVFITSQNHGFAVDEATLPANVRATHRSLFDGSLQGIALKDKAAFSFQGHPEASPGPHDLKPLFERFNHLMLRRLQAQLKAAGGRLMPKRTDIQSILIIGAGPIIIGQAAEFDYSGAQACKALREEGYRVILVNSNPATIMTDPGMADAIYIEPVNWKTVARIIEKERPDALLPTMGGQTALNTALDLVREGVLEKYKVELIAASRGRPSTWRRIGSCSATPCARSASSARGPRLPAASRTRSKSWPTRAIPRSSGPRSPWAARAAVSPTTARSSRPSWRAASMPRPPSEVLLEESVIGWKEYEMEVVRDHKDNCIIICSIENLDPMGVHTGDSITVAPALTLTDKEYQRMRDASIAVLRKIGVDTGGSNVQFAVNPR